MSILIAFLLFAAIFLTPLVVYAALQALGVCE